MKISPNQFTILESLKDGPRWCRSFQSVKPLVEDLAKRGLLERCRPQLGRGCNMVRLTALGCEAIEIDAAKVPATRTGLKPIKPRDRWEIGEIRDKATPLVKTTCEAFLRAVRADTEVPVAVALLAERYGTERSAIWRRLRSGGVLSPYRPKSKAGRRQPYIPRSERHIPVRVLPSPVRRDPCPRCGVRGDIGCKHSGAAQLGMLFG
jgi:DNA-binding MarR family transcriptional regulator